MNASQACYAAGYVTGILAFAWIAIQRRLFTEGIVRLMFIGLIGGLLCAGVSQSLIGGAPGKTVLGGIAGGYACVAIGKKLMGIDRPLGDLFAVAISAGESVGRWGCYFGGCCYGKECQAPWAVHQHGAMRHPTQIYLSLANFVILVILCIYNHRRPPENSLFYLQGVLYCIIRFLIEFYRETPPPILGLSTAQWACLAGSLFFGWKLRSLHLREVSQ